MLHGVRLPVLVLALADQCAAAAAAAEGYGVQSCFPQHVTAATSMPMLL